MPRNSNKGGTADLWFARSPVINYSQHHVVMMGQHITTRGRVCIRAFAIKSGMYVQDTAKHSSNAH